MRIIYAKDYEDMSKKAADILAAQIILKPDSVLGFATGSTPVGAYRSLTERFKNGEISFSGITGINLDEYVGLAPENPQSYRFFMNSSLFDSVDVDIARTFVPNGLEENADLEAARYEKIIETSGGIDMQLLGMGPNGHIGFNEPGPAFVMPVHKVELTAETIEANKRFFANAGLVPRYAYTMGIRAIMQAKRVLVIASGAQKAKAVRGAVSGPVTPELPASILQLHPDAILIGDEAALSLI